MKKRLLTPILICLVVALQGCATTGKKSLFLVQSVLDQTLPPDFSGDVAFRHDNPYIHLFIRAGNVRRGASGMWTWDWLTYQRSGLSQGSVILGTPPALAPSL